MDIIAIRSDGDEPRLVVTFPPAGGDPEQLHGAAAQFFPRAHLVSADCTAHGTDAAIAFVTAERDRCAATEIVGIGYAGGAGLLAAMSFAAPHLFDVLALMHPVVTDLPAPRSGLAMTRVLLTSGRDDPHCPPAMVQGLSDIYAAEKADVTLAWHPGGHEIPQSEVSALSDFLT